MREALTCEASAGLNASSRIVRRSAALRRRCRSERREIRRSNLKREGTDTYGIVEASIGVTHKF